MKPPAYADEPVHRFVRRYLAATGRPVIREESHQFAAQGPDGVERYTYSPATAEAAARDEPVTLLATGGRTLERMLREAHDRGFALRARSGSGATFAATGAGCLAFPVCGSLPADDSCATCPNRLTRSRLLIPPGATAEPDGPIEANRVLRLTFEIEVRGAETVRELLVVDAGEAEGIQAVGLAQWPLDEDWTADPSIVEEPDGYDRIVALARRRVEELAQPWIEMAMERAADRIAPALRALRVRADAERAEAPTERPAIDAHVAREERALIERHAVYVTTRLVNALALESVVRGTRVRVGDTSRVVPWVAECDTCDKRGPVALLDLSLHVACPTCAARCLGCGAAQCPTCAERDAPCVVCGSVVCGSCHATCSVCAGNSCLVDTEPCAACSRPTCYNCFAECSKDGRLLCVADTVTCVGGETMCSSHVIPTEDGRSACAEHAHPCAFCGRRLSEPALVRTVSGAWACETDRRPCARCARNDWYLAGEVTNCSVGGELICIGAHAIQCGVGDTVCSVHSVTCSWGHPACTAHVTQCITGKEPVCATHVVVCAGCWGPLCGQHSAQCPACGSVVCPIENRPLCEVCQGPGCPGCGQATRCRACQRLGEAVPKDVPPAVLAANGGKVPRYLGLGADRIVSVDHGLVRSTITVIEAGTVRSRRTLGPFERRGLGL